jgi:hypothetical protein
VYQYTTRVEHGPPVIARGLKKPVGTEPYAEHRMFLVT